MDHHKGPPPAATAVLPAALPPPAAPAVTRARLDSPDLLRGLVMVLMALDHVRDFFSGAHFDPLDLTRTTPGLFFTRWITHFCAPTFILLAGAGAYLYGQRGHDRAGVARFLLTRGLWLVLLELTVIRFGWFFNFDYSVALAIVIWAIGWSMVALAGLAWLLPHRAVAAVGIAIILLHNTLDPLTPAQFGPLAWLWTVLHEGGVVPLAGQAALMVGYPLLPWIGVMAAGYGLGPLLLRPTAHRRRALLTLGLGLTAAFVFLGLLNAYGDPTPWAHQPSLLHTVLAFLDNEKYPPSLLYLLMTLGPAITALAFLDNLPDSPLKRFFLVFGRVPLFYYVLHIVLIHSLAVAAAYFVGLDPHFLFVNHAHGDYPAPWGFSLPVIYLVWIAVVLALYPACSWFARVKARSGHWWMSYL